MQVAGDKVSLSGAVAERLLATPPVTADSEDVAGTALSRSTGRTGDETPRRRTCGDTGPQAIMNRLTGSLGLTCASTV